MTTPQALHHSLLRPCILHILRAAGYHSTRPSVLDTLTDLAARYMFLLAQATANHAALNHTEPELALEISVQDVRMALQDCGALIPEKPMVEQEFDGEEDTRGMDAFLAWVQGQGNKEIRRVALEGDSEKQDYLAALKKKHNTTTEGDTRYNGTILGKPAEPRAVKVEGGDISSVKEWAERLKRPRQDTSIVSSRRQSSVLSSLADEMMDGIEF
ncbi:Transcription initiation factor TFIID subunit 3 [Lachnellula cervina]|uniref:Transcription initiation factor TFIID subunit 3 n=1 Tax=Lachnellula cervina TaxID=1316786 RepID=A0A7D8Z194_9HELO|nr:Transcription initiation factor TFIID subunit 3 [Lachnellula cervina]